jgi:probable O-glycosylation ligase (exosortase A-associated)
MSIRDLLVTFSILSVLPVCLFRPWVGVLTWSWLAYMNPHRLSWGFAHELPFSLLVALVTLVGFVFTSSRRPFLWTRETLLLGLLWGWFAVTSMGAFYPEDAWRKFGEMSKVLLMAVLVIPLFQDREKLRILLFVIAASLGFYGVKGGVFVLRTGGQDMVLGAPNSFFEANTEMALVLNMALPLLFYLAKEETRRWRRLTLYGAFALTMIAVPFTYSRGGLFGLVTVLVVLFVKARRRLMLVPVMAAGIVAFVLLAPPQWLSRMQTLENVQADGSANLRFMSWKVAISIAQDSPVVGGGFKVFIHRATYDIYMPEYPRAFGHDAHSIYFNLLGEHGWVGLVLFLAFVGAVLLRLYQIRRLARARPEVAWAGNYAHMLQASIAVYLVNGATLSVAYFDLAYQLLILAPLIHAVAMQQLAAEPAASPAPAAPLPVAATPVRAG